MQPIPSSVRNLPCMCGSGRKFKKCCLEAHRQQRPRLDDDRFDAAGFVDRVLATGNMLVLGEVLNFALDHLFERGAPLSHVRLRPGGGPDVLDPSALARRYNAAWMCGCQAEISLALAGAPLHPRQRNALGVVHIFLQRPNAHSLFVAALALLEHNEQLDRRRRLIAAMRQVTVTDGDVDEILQWLPQHQPSILSFAEWFALAIVPVERLEAVWSNGIALRAGEFCLAEFERRDLAAGRPWALLAALLLIDDIPEIKASVFENTPPRSLLPDEQPIYDRLTAEPEPTDLPGIIPKVLTLMEARSDFASAWLVREAARFV